jgi:hypothetical protein
VLLCVVVVSLQLCCVSCEEVHRNKKVREFLFPSRDVTTKLSLGGNNDVITELFLPRGSLVSDIPAGDGKLVNLFLRCIEGLGDDWQASPSHYTVGTPGWMLVGGGGCYSYIRFDPSLAVS